MNEIEVTAVCYSKKEDVSIGFGTSIDSPSISDDLYSSGWISIGMSESFWENCEEFSNGVNKAKHLMECNSVLTYRQALYEVFGDFVIIYELEGTSEEKEFIPNDGFDINKEMYDMLEHL